MIRKMLAAWLCAALVWGCAMAEDTSKVASEADMTDVIDIVEEGMEPVSGDMLKDGEYEAEVDVSSSMFKVVGCRLTVADGQITARLYMKSDAYEYMYAGTAEDAAQAEKDALCAIAEDERGYYFTLPVDALDAGYTCAAFSGRKQVWYPRTLVFRSDSLPLEAWREEYLTTAKTLGLEDGEYTCPAYVTGGGKASLDGDAILTVTGGEAVARIRFTTSKIDYALMGDTKYLPVEGEDKAAFDLPVAAFDRKLGLIIDSTAIKPATEVAYSLVFVSEGIEKK